MSLEDKLAELYEYDNDIEGGERHKADWIKYASNLLRESFPAPIEPVKDAMELATLISQRCHTKAAAWFDIDEAAALIQSSFEEWKADEPKPLGGPLTIDAVNAGMDVGLNDDKASNEAWKVYLSNSYANRIARTIRASRHSASAPSGELYALIDQLCKLGNEDMDGNSDGNRIAQKARALLASRPARCGYDMGGECAVDKDKPAPTDEKALKALGDMRNELGKVGLFDRGMLARASYEVIERAIFSHESPKEQV